MNVRTGVPLHNPITGGSLTFVDLSPECLVMEATYAPGSGLAVAHFHPHQTERFTVLEGNVRVVVDGDKRFLQQGEVLEVPIGAVHQFGGGSELGRVRWEVRPALRTAELLATGYGLAEAGLVNPQTGSPRFLQSSLLLTAHDDEFRLPAPPRPVQRVLFAVMSRVARLRGLEAEHAPAAFR